MNSASKEITADGRGFGEAQEMSADIRASCPDKHLGIPSPVCIAEGNRNMQWGSHIAKATAERHSPNGSTMSTEQEKPDEITSQRQPIEKADGVTAAERYLARLCSKTFLSLWSYPAVYRDQGKPQNGGDGKEICDLLLVFGQHIIIFSDKHCELRESENVELDWQRWFRKAVQKSAEQLWGAERWLRQNPTRVFLDRKCEQSLPIDLPRITDARLHLVVVAHGISPRIRAEFKGSGSLLINTNIKGFQQHVVPFHVGDLAPEKTFVHVLDDDSLDLLMTQRDTISDFVGYLLKRQMLLRGTPAIRATGEEQLLAIYLRNFSEAGEHVFVFPDPPQGHASQIFVPEGHWEDFQKQPERLEQLRQDRISYSWDKLIEKFNHYALRGEQYFVTKGGIKDTEKVLRFMAREPRWKRRYLAHALLDMLRTTPDHLRRLRVLPPVDKGDPYYVFLLLPIPSSVDDEHYRLARRNFLESCCAVVRLEYPNAMDIVGIATESGLKNQGRSEDAIYFDGSHWTEETARIAKLHQEELRILKSARRFEEQMEEYPAVPAPPAEKNPRNKPCPCGSGKKYKHCCLKKLR